MKIQRGANLALITLLGCSLAFPVFAQDTNPNGQTTTGQTTQPTGRRGRRRAMEQSNTQTTATTNTMSPTLGAEDVAANDAIFASFQQNLDKANSTLDQLSKLLDEIVARGSQAQPPPAGGAGQGGGTGQ